jgi:Mn-dependent DtxR family transcriptional regulator
MGKTKDERYLLRLYEMANEFKDPKTPLNREAVGKTIGLSPKAVKTICTLLAQANFIKKYSADEIYLTDHGIHLAQQLRENR